MQCLKKQSKDYIPRPQQPCPYSFIDSAKLMLQQRLKQLKAQKTFSLQSTLQFHKYSLSERQQPSQKVVEIDDSRKQRRKLNNKKRRKRKQALKQGITQLRDIVDQIYYRESTFDDLKPDMLSVIQKIPDPHEFNNHLNSFIRDYIEDTSDYLSSEFVNIIQTIEKQKNEREGRHQPEDPARFHHQFVNIIYQQYIYIKMASPHIERFIELYYEISGYDYQQEDYDRGLGRALTTFNHLLNDRQNLKCLLFDAEKFFELYAPKYDNTAMKLREMLNCLLQDQWDSDEDREVSTEDGSQNYLVGRTNPKKSPGGKDSTPNQHLLDQAFLTQLSKITCRNPRLQCQFNKKWLKQLESLL